MRKSLIPCLCVLAAALLFGVAEAALSAELLRERAKNLYSVQDYRRALVLFDRLLDEIPGDGEALDYSAWCLRYIGDWKSAEERFHEALEAPSGVLTSWIHVGLGETYLGAGDEKKAINSFRTAIGAAPGDEELYLRSLKGIAWAKAFLGERDEYENTLAMIEMKDGDFAAEVAADTTAVVEEREKLRAAKAADEEPVEPILILDTLERHDKLLAKHSLDEEVDEILNEFRAMEAEAVPAAEIAQDVIEIVILTDAGPEATKPVPAPHEMPPCESSLQSEPVAPKPEIVEEKIELVLIEEVKPDEPAPKVVEKPVEPATKPVKPAKPAAPAVRKADPQVVQSGVLASPPAPPTAVWGIRLGAALGEELARIEADGIEMDKEARTDRHGVLHFGFVPKKSAFPADIRAQAASEYYHIEGFSNFVLKAEGVVKTKPLGKPLEWKRNTFDSMKGGFSEKYGKPTIFNDYGASSEAAWLLPERRVLWLFASAGLDGTCSIQLSYVDRRIQAGHLIGILR